MALKIGLIGAGDVARSAHMPSYAANPKVEVVAVADPNTDAAQALAGHFGIPKVTENYHDILDDPEVAAVDLCVPHHLHYGMALDALNEGKHVILDKPIALTTEEADRMIEAARELGLWLLVVLNQRYMPIHRMVREYLSDGKIGKPFLVNALVTG
ncbi:MAG: Gfo/Idh/MocA family protein, partial [Armatimonadota bacterium]